jgi:hypothetical protein
LLKRQAGGYKKKNKQTVKQKEKKNKGGKILKILKILGIYIPNKSKL